MEYPSGIQFPFKFASSGGIRIASGAAKVWSDLAALVKSALNERLVRKDVGTVGYRLVLRSNLEADSGIIENLVLESILRWIPAITGVTVKVYEKELPDGMAIFGDVGFVYMNTGAVINETLRLDS